MEQDFVIFLLTGAEIVPFARQITSSCFMNKLLTVNKLRFVSIAMLQLKEKLLQLQNRLLNSRLRKIKLNKQENVVLD